MRYIAVMEMVRVTVYTLMDYMFMCCVCGLNFYKWLSLFHLLFPKNSQCVFIGTYSLVQQVLYKNMKLYTWCVMLSTLNLVIIVLGEVLQ